MYIKQVELGLSDFLILCSNKVAGITTSSQLRLSGEANLCISYYYWGLLKLKCPIFQRIYFPKNFPKILDKIWKFQKFEYKIILQTFYSILFLKLNSLVFWNGEYPS